MARPQRSSHPAVISQLQQTPERFAFFQAVQVLERIAARRGLVAVGEDGPLLQEAIRLRSAVTSTFPAAEIDRLQTSRVEAKGAATSRPASPQPAVSGDGTASQEAQAAEAAMVPCELTVNFMGLVGPQGTLPHHYTQLVVTRLHPRHKDETLKQFLDLFHHRSISLFFRAWQKHRLPASFEAAHLWKREKSRHLFQFLLQSLVGLSTEGLAERPICGSATVLGYAGHFAHQPRNAVALERVIGDWLQWPVVIEQFSGRWLPLPQSSRSAFPGPHRPQGQNLALGVSTIIGSRVWECQGKFRVCLGPLSYEQFTAIMPNGPLFQPMCDLVRLYAGIEFDFDFQPLLQPQEIPGCRLSSAASSSKPYLGWNTWLSTRPPARPAGEATFRPQPLK